MAFYDKFPYTNFQELNLDKIMHKIGDIDRAEEASAASAAAAKASEINAENSQQAATESASSASQSANASAASANASAASASESAQYLEEIGTHTAGAVSDWLAEHVTTPTTPPLDTSLMIAGAAADAKATGDAITELKNNVSLPLAGGTNATTPIPSGADFNTYLTPGSYSISTAADTDSISNVPIRAGGRLLVFAYRSATSGQFYITSANRIFVRAYFNSEWTDWAEVTTGYGRTELANILENRVVSSKSAASTVPSGSDLNNYKTPGIYTISSDAVAASINNCPVTVANDFVVFNARGGDLQYGYGTSQMLFTDNTIWFRQWKNSRWFGWRQLAGYSEIQWINSNLKIFDVFNLIKNIGQPYHSDRTNNGIHFLAVVNSDFLKWNIDGTATENASCTMYQGNMSDIGMEPGQIYRIDIHDFPPDLFVNIRFTLPTGNRFFELHHSQYFRVPADATDTILIQMIAPTGASYDAVTFETPHIYKASASELPYYITWASSGVIMDDGSIATAASRVYTPEAMQFDHDVIIRFDSTRSVQVMYYDSADNIITKNTYGWMDGENYVVIDAGSRFRLNVKLIPNASQSIQQMTETFEHVHILTLKEKAIEDYANYNDDWASLSMYQTISVIGDSYASGPVNNYPMSWGQMMARDIGATLINLSHGGAYTKTWLTNNDWGLNKMLSDPPQQLYICAMGINDYTRIKNNEYTLGTIADIHSDPSENPDTFYGNYGKIISNIQTHAPNASIVMLSVARPYERVMDPNIEEIAAHFEIPYIYLPDDWFFRSQYFRDTWYSDHPRPYGYGGMAKAIRRLLEKAIKVNHDYFYNYMG